MQIVQDNATATAGLGSGFAEAGADVLAQVRLIQPNKILGPDLNARQLSMLPHTHMAKSLSL